MTTFKLTLINEEKGINTALNIPEHMSILEAANEADIRLPFLCRTGDCSSCVCKLIDGTINHGPQTVLKEEHREAGFILACSSFATSDITVETHKEKDFIRLKRSASRP